MPLLTSEPDAAGSRLRTGRMASSSKWIPVAVILVVMCGVSSFACRLAAADSALRGKTKCCCRLGKS